jgi:hypothetical protein
VVEDFYQTAHEQRKRREKKTRIFQHKLKPKSATKATIRRNNNG